jgi:hypothetical protein
LSVHVQALVDLGQRLGQSVEEIRRPIQALSEMNGVPELSLGAFAEAFSFSDDHADLTAEMAALLGKVARAVEFAATATRIVAGRYQAMETGGAQSVAASVGLAPPTGTVFAAGFAPVPPSSLAPPDPRLVEVLVPATGGTVYVSSGGPGGTPIAVTVEATTT